MTFHIVGGVLGASESVATRTHVAPRVEKAIATSRRLQHLELPVLIDGESTLHSLVFIQLGTVAEAPVPWVAEHITPHSWCLCENCFGTMQMR